MYFQTLRHLCEPSKHQTSILYKQNLWDSEELNRFPALKTMRCESSTWPNIRKCLRPVVSVAYPLADSGNQTLLQGKAQLPRVHAHWCVTKIHLGFVMTSLYHQAKDAVDFFWLRRQVSLLLLVGRNQNLNWAPLKASIFRFELGRLATNRSLLMAGECVPAA